MEQIPLTTIGLIAAIFGGFFALIKYVLTKQEKVVDSFLVYIEKKNGNLERVANDFSAHTERTNEAMTKVSVELAKFSSLMDFRLKK